jgi:LysM repeat protein
VKLKVFFILAGVVALHLILLAGVCMTGGCKSPEVLGQRSYIPAPEAKESSPVVVEQKEEIKFTSPTEQVNIEKTVKFPAQTAPAALPPFEPIKAQAIEYKVQKGDSFWKIGRKYGVSMQELAAYNKMSLKQPLRTGQTIMIPPGGAPIPADKLKKVHRRRPAKKASKTYSRKKIKSVPRPKDGLYTVKSGDSLWKIAVRFNLKTSTLAQANNLDPKKSLRIGQRLVIPGSQTPEKIAPAASPTPAKPVMPQTTAKQTTDDILDSALDPAAKKAPAAPKAQPVAAPEKVSATTLLSKTDTIEVPQDISVDNFAKQYGLKVDDIKKLNPDLPKDGKLKAGKIIIIPSAE